MKNLPPCGIYKTADAIGDIPKGVLVYFHNHGNPGPGLYPPKQWIQNKAFFSEKGMTVDDLSGIDKKLVGLPLEGFYITTQRLDFDDKAFIEEGVLVQIGYNGSAEPILFFPSWDESGLTLPERGRKVEPGIFGSLKYARVKLDMQLQDATVH